MPCGSATRFPANRSPPTWVHCQADDSSSCSLIPSQSGRPYLAQQRSCFPCVQTRKSGSSSCSAASNGSIRRSSSCSSTSRPASRSCPTRESATYVATPSWWRRSGRRMKRSRVRGRAATSSRSLALTWSERPLPARASWLQRLRYSTSSQWSMRLAVAPSGSSFSLAISEQNGRCASPLLTLDDADDLAGLHRLPGLHGELGDPARPVRGDLVLHLHRLDDAEHLAGLDLVAVGDFDREHGALHRADDGVARRAVVRPGGDALSPSPDELGVRRLGEVELELVTAPVQLGVEDAFAGGGTVRRRGYCCCLMRKLRRTLRKLVRLHDAVTRLALGEAGMLEQRLVEAEQRGHALDPVLPERAEHAATRVLPVDSVDAELGDEWVVETDDVPPRLHAGVHSHARTARLHVARDPPRAGQEAVGWILRVDPALDRVPRQPDVLLAQPQRLTRRDQHLLTDEVEPRDQLGDRVLHLDPGVHLEEEVLAFLREQTLDRPGRAVADRPGRVDGDLPDPLAEVFRDGGRRRLLDQLLVATLDRAVALPEMDHGAVRVGQHLNLDVPRVLEVALDIDSRVGEIGLALAAGGLEGAGVPLRPA